MFTRRQWMRLALGAGTGGLRALALGASSACDSDCPDPDPTLACFAEPTVTADHDYSLGVATFEVGSDSAMIWAYNARDAAMHALVQDIDTGACSEPIALAPSGGGTGFALIGDLVPDRAYRYQIITHCGLASTLHQFRTAPGPDQPAELTFLTSGDYDQHPRFYTPIIDTMARTPAAFYLSLGDWPYADDARTTSEYRVLYRRSREPADIRRLLERMPVYAIYDDHEMRNNWDAMFRDTEAERIQAALGVWDEFFPLRPAARPGQRYRTFSWGQLVQFWMLDTRLYRSANAVPDDADKTMLGAEQRQWLEQTLAASVAPFKIVITSVPLDFGYGVDHWAGFTTERDRILQFIIDQDISGVIFLAADQHWFAAHHHAAGLKEFQLGALARDLFDPPPDHPLRVASAFEFNYGEITIRTRPELALDFACKNADGAELYRETVLPGRGRLQIDSDTPRAFTITGAHTFVGVAPAVLPMATPGPYTVRWNDGAAPQNGELGDGQTLVFTHPALAR
jgi:phosphodiesterase/alkaline phosphatase D-like protein